MPRSRSAASTAAMSLPRLAHLGYNAVRRTGPYRQLAALLPWPPAGYLAARPCGGPSAASPTLTPQLSLTAGSGLQAWQLVPVAAGVTSLTNATRVYLKVRLLRACLRPCIVPGCHRPGERPDFRRLTARQCTARLQSTRGCGALYATSLLSCAGLALSGLTPGSMRQQWTVEKWGVYYRLRPAACKGVFLGFSSYKCNMSSATLLKAGTGIAVSFVLARSAVPSQLPPTCPPTRRCRHLRL